MEARKRLPGWVWPATAIVIAGILGISARSAAGIISEHHAPVIITRTVTHTVTDTVTPKPKVIVKHHTRTITVPDPGQTSCITNLWRSYVSLADGGPAGDPSLFQVDCPGVHINGLTY